ncbi:DUF4394 domain-containing protein, partial [Akkermansiaceae bacterium]|nr:DUF4394 domain-containing protein [Akkermansiaceae bacterium]
MKKLTAHLIAVLFASCGFAFGQGLNNGLVAYYPLNGDAQDLSGRGNDGNVVGGVVSTTDRTGTDSGALSFNGNNASIEIADNPSLRPTESWTVSAWVKPENLGIPYNERILDKGGSNGSGIPGYALWYDADRKFSFLSTWGGGVQGERLVSTTTVNSSDWYLVTGTYDGNTSRLYINGSLEASAQNEWENRSTNPLLIGRYYNTSYWTGSIDEVRIYNRALSEQEVTTLYGIESNPPATAGLYGLDHTSDELVKIDTETGAVSTVGPLGIDVTAFTGLDYDPSSGLLITSIPTNSDNVLYEINLDTGLATIFKIIPKTGDADIEQLGFAEDGTLYAWNEVGGFTQGDLWTVDISNGTFTKIGNSSLPNVLGADYQEGSGFWVSDEWNGRVYKLNETTAQIELTGPAIWYTGNGPGDLWDMDFGYDGLLRVAASDESLPSVLLTINQEDGSEISRVTLSREILAISSIPPTNVIPDGNTYELDLTQSSLDSSVWKTYSPTIHGHTGSHQIVQGDRLELSNAEWLYLAEPPNSVASVEGSFTLRDSYDIMWVSLNSGADPSIRTNMLPADGVNVSMGNRQGGVRIDLLGASSKVLVTAPFNFSVGQTYNFLIVDDGQNLSVKINGNEVASADYRSEPGFIDGGSNVVIQNREGWPGPHTAYLHSYKVSSPSPEYTVDILDLENGTVTGGGTFSLGAEATLTATPAAGYVFASWNGDVSSTDNPLILTLDGNKSIGATFTPVSPAAPVVQLGAFYESPSGEAVVIDATPTVGFPTEFTYQWCF